MRVLRVLLLELIGERRLPELAASCLLTSQQDVLHVLLGDRRAALDEPALLGVGVRGPHDGPEIHALVLPEPLVLDGHDGLAQHVGHVGQLHGLPVLLAVEGRQQRAVVGRDSRRLRLDRVHGGGL